MSFRGLPDAECSGDPEAAHCDEIYIHNYGITLPRICEGPDRRFLYKTWKNGIAANPVFTDSAHCC
jgi:hypothetical protein